MGKYRRGRVDMKILIIGGGGREHAIAWKLSKSPRVEKIYCAPGNAGIAEIAECVNIGVMEFDRQVAFAKEHGIDLTVVAPDDPLAAGAVDAFEAAGLRAFGPRANAAILEGSKAFSKDLMKKYNIPTAAYETFTDPEEAIKYLETARMPIVLKADGLCRRRDRNRGIYDRTGGFRLILCGWKDHQNHDFCSGSQAGKGWGSGIKYRRNGHIFPKSLLYLRGRCILQGKDLSAYGGCHESGGQRI